MSHKFSAITSTTLATDWILKTIFWNYNPNNPYQTEKDWLKSKVILLFFTEPYFLDTKSEFVWNFHKTCCYNRTSKFRVFPNLGFSQISSAAVFVSTQLIKACLKLSLKIAKYQNVQQQSHRRGGIKPFIIWFLLVLFKKTTCFDNIKLDYNKTIYIQNWTLT